MQTKQVAITRERVMLNGEEKFFLGYKSPLLNEKGEAVGFILGISTDITELVAIENKLEIAKRRAEPRLVKRKAGSLRTLAMIFAHHYQALTG